MTFVSIEMNSNSRNANVAVTVRIVGSSITFGFENIAPGELVSDLNMSHCPIFQGGVVTASQSGLARAGQC